MDPTLIQSGGVMLLGLAAVVVAVGQLVKQMGASYGAIIASLQGHIVSLQTQNALQQVQMDQNAAQIKQMAEDHKKCREDIGLLMADRARLSEVERKVNGGSHP